jgi:hypothetical protein
MSRTRESIGHTLLIGAIELHRVTGEPTSLDAARHAVDRLLVTQPATNGPGRGAFGNLGDTTAAALAQSALAYLKVSYLLAVSALDRAVGE